MYETYTRDCLTGERAERRYVVPLCVDPSRSRYRITLASKARLPDPLRSRSPCGHKSVRDGPFPKRESGEARGNRGPLATPRTISPSRDRVDETRISSCEISVTGGPPKTPHCACGGRSVRADPPRRRLARPHALTGLGKGPLIGRSPAEPTRGTWTRGPRRTSSRRRRTRASAPRRARAGRCTQCRSTIARAA